MDSPNRQLISIVIPCFNEGPTIVACYEGLKRVAVADRHYTYEYLFVDDGSTDDTLLKLQAIAAKDTAVRLVSFTRNFGKEIATTAGLQHAGGVVSVVLDADGQHPFDLIPEFIKTWEGGAKVVIGVRSNPHSSAWKSLTSGLFYRLFNNHSDIHLVPGSTDFRLIDAEVRHKFTELSEHNRITRGLIDWLGYNPTYIRFNIQARTAGEASYGFSKLVGLALNSFVSLSLKPLYIMAYTGFAVLALSTLLALFSATEMLIGDPLNLQITGSAYLVMLVLFLLGIILISQGVLALYISHIHTESKHRPLYVIDDRASRGLPKE